jgi:hypothetical protein
VCVRACVCVFVHMRVSLYIVVHAYLLWVMNIKHLLTTPCMSLVKDKK